MIARAAVFCVLFSLVACSGAKNYEDSPDLSATREAFNCSSPGDLRQRRACTGLSRFEQAGPVTSYPTTGTKTYLGRVDCSDDEDRGKLVFSTRGLRPGTPPTKVDDQHRAKGIIVHMMAVFAPSEVRNAAAEATMHALTSQGANPGIAAEAQADGLLPASWEDWRARLTSDTPGVTARSDGRSLLISPGFIPAFWDDATKTKAYAFMREIDNELIYVRPPTHSVDLGQQACVEHLFAVPNR